MDDPRGLTEEASDSLASGAVDDTPTLGNVAGRHITEDQQQTISIIRSLELDSRSSTTARRIQRATGTSVKRLARIPLGSTESVPLDRFLVALRFTADVRAMYTLWNQYDVALRDNVLARLVPKLVRITPGESETASSARKPTQMKMIEKPTFAIH